MADLCDGCGGASPDELGAHGYCATCKPMPVEPPARVLLCLGPCHGEFYLPLGLNDAIVCPNDRSHPVALYQSPSIHAGEDVTLPADEADACPACYCAPCACRPIIGNCSECGDAREDEYTCRGGGHTVLKEQAL